MVLEHAELSIAGKKAKLLTKVHKLCCNLLSDTFRGMIYMETMTITIRWIDASAFKNGAFVERGTGAVIVIYPDQQPIFQNVGEFDKENKFLQYVLPIAQQEINKAEKNGYFAETKYIGMFLNGKIETLVMKRGLEENRSQP